MNQAQPPEKKPQEEKPQDTAPPTPPAEEQGAPAPEVTAPAAEVDESISAQVPPAAPGALFPYDPPSEHWNADFGDSKQVYEGSALPVWLLAGWAIFILWAVIYLVAGLPSAF